MPLLLRVATSCQRRIVLVFPCQSRQYLRYSRRGVRSNVLASRRVPRLHAVRTSHVGIRQLRLWLTASSHRAVVSEGWVTRDLTHLNCTTLPRCLRRFVRMVCSLSDVPVIICSLPVITMTIFKTVTVPIRIGYPCRNW